MKNKVLCVFLITAFIFCSIFGWIRFRKDTIYIHPGPSWKKLFNKQGDGFFGLRHILEAQGIKLREKRYVKKLRNAKLVIFFDVLKEYEPYFSKYDSILWIWEPPSVLPDNFNTEYHKLFNKIYTWDDDLVDNVKYFKYYPTIDSFEMTSTELSFEDKKLCTLINSPHTSTHPFELYSERERVIRFFEKNAPNDFDLYGRGWDLKQFPLYKGSVADKKILGNYRFAICYENIHNINGYVTEKILEAMRASCVPVYWGADNITKYVPANCFVDRRQFKDNQHMYEYLQKMPKEKHERYLENIRKYFLSDKIQVFSQKHFIKTFQEAVKA